MPRPRTQRRRTAREVRQLTPDSPVGDPRYELLDDYLGELPVGEMMVAVEVFSPSSGRHDPRTVGVVRT
ncbi:MAG TPA: hypothetical protein VH539_09240 [Gemmatimonadaceae bacterium]|jgi:hypothetical protein